MCGIFGAINLDGFFNNKDYKLFVHLTDLVSYRGPDASGYLAVNMREQSINDQNKFDIYLGHRRLSIIDLSDNANQPLSDGSGIWIIYNGEIFNYIELKNELQSKGYFFKTKSDTEVILNIYKKYGEKGFEKLNGMWAFAIVDLPKRKIVLSRDRFSIKPLYYTLVNSHFYFASEIKQLIPLLNTKELNKNIMFKYLEQGLINYNEETFYQHIYKLRPKHNMIIKIDSRLIREEKYWDYSNEYEVLTLNDMLEKFHDLFLDSVRIRLRSDVKIGALLSGGLDSSSISVIANKFHNGKFYTYSIISKNKRYSEERYIDILSKKSGIHNYKVPFEFEDNTTFIKYIDKVIYHNDEPFNGFSTVAQYKALEALKKNTNITVVLSGQGGDETLMGYLKYFFFNLKELFNKKEFIRALSQIMLSFINRTVIWQFKLSEARRYIPFLIERTSKPFLKIHDTFEPIWNFKNLRERQILDIDKYSVPSLTHYEDRNSMAHSLEIRLPFLDYRLVNFTLNLPITLKLNKGWTKYILRKSLYELPDEIRWRKDKQGFLIPEEQWLKRNLSSLITRLFKKSILDEMEIINSNLFLQYYRDFQKGKKYIWYTDISRVLIAELWARKNFIGAVENWTI